MAESRSVGKVPDFSIIIPTYNRPVQLEGCLEALCGLAFSRDRFEVLVVNDGGADLQGLVSRFQERMCVRLLQLPENTGPAAARNCAATAARGRYLAFTDDDCRPSAAWLCRLQDRSAADSLCAVTGRMQNQLTDNLCSAASQSIIDTVVDYYNGNSARALFAISSNLAVAASRFRDINGFDPHFRAAEDRELANRWLLYGGRLVYAEDAVVYHAHELDFASLWRQHAAYGRGASCYHRRRAELGQGGLRPDLRFYWKLVSRPLRNEFTIRGLLLTALTLLALTANLAGFLREELSRWNRGK